MKTGIHKGGIWATLQKQFTTVSSWNEHLVTVKHRLLFLVTQIMIKRTDNRFITTIFTCFLAQCYVVTSKKFYHSAWLVNWYFLKCSLPHKLLHIYGVSEVNLLSAPAIALLMRNAQVHFQWNTSPYKRNCFRKCVFISCLLLLSLLVRFMVGFSLL